MTDLRDRRTGDATYQARVDRFEYIMRRLAETPKPTYQTIANELGLAKQNIGRYVKRGTVRPSGRQPNDEARKKAIVGRLTMWQARRAHKMAKGLDVAFEEKWIADLEARLRQLV